jgi:glutamine---fructose-6-phosphate transaminase (isomerizing)
MARGNSRMAKEIAEVPEVVRQQERDLARPLAELVAQIDRLQPRFVLTCARGSSAHAATFAKHLIERYVGLPVGAAAPSIASVYGQQLRLDGQLLLAVSQSGRSFDLIELAKNAKASGAITAAIVNDTEGPLAEVCEFVLPMGAGNESSVAATKTFIAALSVLLRLIGRWTGDDLLQAAVGRLPDRLDKATLLDWTAALDPLGSASSIMIGRGPTLAIAREAALKLKETCNLHAEAFSGAEFLHGPVALAAPQYPLLMFMPTDAAEGTMRQLAADLREKGTSLLVAEPGPPEPGRLPALPPEQPEADAVCMIQSFYAMAVQLAERLGTSPDRPRHLTKVTSTR